MAKKDYVFVPFLRCYYCGKAVTPEENRHIQKAMDVVSSVAENSFVHMTFATPENLDEGGNVVICPADFVREVADSWEG